MKVLFRVIYILHMVPPHSPLRRSKPPFFLPHFPHSHLQALGLLRRPSLLLPPLNPPHGSITASSNPDFAAKLFDFLSPRGTLISAIFAVDKLSVVKYVLPEWFRLSLGCAKDYCRVLSDLCPLFRGRVMEDEIVKGNYQFQVHLNVFEYFVFWFAYYPVCSGNSENLGFVSVSSSRKSRLENWTSSIPVLPSGIKRSPEQKGECNLY